LSTSRRAGGRAALCALAGAVVVVVAPSAAASPFSQQRLHARTSAPSAPVTVRLAPLAPAGPWLAPAGLLALDPPSLGVGLPLVDSLQGSDDQSPTDPPDQALAVGQGSVLQLANVVGRIWQDGVPGGVFPLSQLFATGSDVLRQPWALYDASTNRYFAGVFDVTLAGEVIAVSQTGSPSDSWFVYRFPWTGSGGTCPADGQAGISSDILALSTDVYATCDPGASFSGAAFSAFPKMAMISGFSASYSFIGPVSWLYSTAPATSTSPTATQYFAGVDRGSGSVVRLVVASGVPPQTSFSFGSVPVPAYVDPPAASQKGSPVLLPTGPSHVTRAAFQKGRLALAFSESCMLKGDLVAHSCVRIVSVDTVRGVAVLSASVGRKGRASFAGAAAFLPGGQIVVPFTVSSPGMYPSLSVVAASANGKVSVITSAASGLGPEDSGSFDDSTAVAADPLNPAQAWIAGEIGLAPGPGSWGTAIVPVAVT
jgi:hypothetical protein